MARLLKTQKGPFWESSGTRNRVAKRSSTDNSPFLRFTTRYELPGAPTQPTLLRKTSHDLVPNQKRVFVGKVGGEVVSTVKNLSGFVSVPNARFSL